MTLGPIGEGLDNQTAIARRAYGSCTVQPVHRDALAYCRDGIESAPRLPKRSTRVCDPEVMALIRLEQSAVILDKVLSDTCS